MKQRVVLVLGALLLALLVGSSLEIYRSSWAVDSSITTVRRNTEATQPANWGTIWVAPLKTTVSDTSTGLVAALFKQALTGVGFSATSAPLTVPPGFDSGLVGVFLSLEKWEVKRTITGWRAVATATTEGWPLAYDPSRPQAEIATSVSAAGRYVGWLKRSTVERQLAEQLVKTAAAGIHKDLRSFPLPEALKPAKGRFGFSYSLRRATVARSSEQLAQGVSHPLLMQNAKVNYSWELPHKTVLAYRVTATADEIESFILKNVGEIESGPSHFVDSIRGRRQLVVPNVTHYPISGVKNTPLDKRTERQVLILLDKGR